LVVSVNYNCSFFPYPQESYFEMFDDIDNVPLASDCLSEAVQNAIKSLDQPSINPVQGAVPGSSREPVQGAKPGPFVLRGKRPSHWKDPNPKRIRLWDQQPRKFPTNLPILLEGPFDPYPGDFDSPPLTPEPFG
jgi:hypothetical protein